MICGFIQYTFDLIFLANLGATYSSGLISIEAGFIAGLAAGDCIDRNA